MNDAGAPLGRSTGSRGGGDGFARRGFLRITGSWSEDSPVGHRLMRFREA
jgi:hypothetical protein